MKPKRMPVCDVRIQDHLSYVFCNICHRLIGTFSKHESAMNWAHAHANGSKHIKGRTE